jgi:hypothetical protein
VFKEKAADPVSAELTQCQQSMCNGIELFSEVVISIEQAARVAELSSFVSRQGQMISPFPKISTLNPVQLITGYLFSGVKRPWREAE